MNSLKRILRVIIAVISALLTVLFLIVSCMLIYESNLGPGILSIVTTLIFAFVCYKALKQPAKKKTGKVVVEERTSSAMVSTEPVQLVSSNDIPIKDDAPLSKGVPSDTKRSQKGNSILRILSDYIVVDIETTGLDPGFDDIIELAAIRIKDNEIIGQFQTLVNPRVELDDFIIELTGITNEMLTDAPFLEDVLPSFIDFIGESILVGHNVNFDVNFLYDKCMECLNKPLTNNFLDTMRFSRRLFKEYSRHRLTDLVQRFGIERNVEHRALADVLVTNECYRFMINCMAEKGIDIASLMPQKKKASAKDVQATESEFKKNSEMSGKVFVFTGKLEKVTRWEAMQFAVNAGGLCSDTVTKKVNYLVLGNHDYNKAVKDGKSTKQRRAEELKLSGFDIEVISESMFFDM